MKKRLALFFGGLGLLLGAMTAVSCDSVDEAFDCQAVCSRYRDCYNASFDVAGCRSTCRAKAANDATVKDAANTCQACMDDKSCAAATFSCPSCAQIIAVSQ